jgi:hypothetical protein
MGGVALLSQVSGTLLVHDLGAVTNAARTMEVTTKAITRIRRDAAGEAVEATFDWRS